MFSYTGLTPQQVLAMKEKYHIYLLKSGRASVSGCECLLNCSSCYPLLMIFLVTEKNVEYVARAIDDVVRNVA